MTSHNKCKLTTYLRHYGTSQRDCTGTIYTQVVKFNSGTAKTEKRLQIDKETILSSKPIV